MKDGYAEIQVNVGNANIPSSFNNISYVRIYKKDDNNNLDYIDLTYEDAKGDEIVVRAEKVDDDTYAAIVDENVSLTDIKAKAESNSAKVQIEPNTTYKTSYDEYKEYQLTSDEQNVNINVKPSSGTNDKTYTLTIYRANTSLESVKVDGTEEIGNVKKEVINGSTADVYEATVTTDKADLYVKAVSDSALVNVSANGTKAEDTASNIWTISGYEINDDSVLLTISIRPSSKISVDRKAYLRISGINDKTDIDVIAKYIDADGIEQTINADTTYLVSDKEFIVRVPYGINKLTELTASTTKDNALAGVYISTDSALTNVPYEKKTYTEKNVALTDGVVSTRYAYVIATDEVNREKYTIIIVPQINLDLTAYTEWNGSTGDKATKLVDENGNVTHNALVSRADNTNIGLIPDDNRVNVSYTYNDATLNQRYGTVQVPNLEEGKSLDIPVKVVYYAGQHYEQVSESTLRIFIKNTVVDLESVIAEYVDTNGTTQTVIAVPNKDDDGNITGYTAYVPEDLEKVDLTAKTVETLANVQISDIKDNDKYTVNKYTWTGFKLTADTTSTNIFVKATDNKTEKAYNLDVIKTNLIPEVTMYPATVDNYNNGYKATYDSATGKFTARVAPGTPGQIKIDKDGYYVRYGYIPNDGSETYANKAKLYADNDEHITWSQWYDGTTLKDNTLPMADLVTGDNAVTLIKVQVGMRATDDVTGTDIGDGNYVGTSKIYNLFVSQMYKDEDNLTIFLDNDTKVNKENSKAETDENGQTVYVYEYGIDKTETRENVTMFVEALTNNNLTKPNTSYSATGTTSTPDQSGKFSYNIKISGGYRSDSVDVKINPYTEGTETVPTIVDIVSTSEAGTEVHYRIKIYRKSSDASIEKLIVPGSDENVGDVDLTKATDVNGVAHYAVTVSTKYLEEDEDGNVLVPVYIRATNNKAVINVTKVDDSYVHETVTDDTSYILVPINVINKKAQVSFTITAEDNSATTSHVVDITTVSADSDIDLIMIATMNTQSMAEEEFDKNYIDANGHEVIVYKGYLSSDDVGKKSSAVTLSIAASEITTRIVMDKKHTIVRVGNGKENEVYNDNQQYQYVYGNGNAHYKYTNKIQEMDKDEYTFMNFETIAEDGVTKKYYEVRLYPMDKDNMNLETKQYPSSDGDEETLVSLWAGEVGTIETMERPNTRELSAEEMKSHGYTDTSIPTYIAYIGNDVTAVEVKGRTEHDYASIKIHNAAKYDIKQQVTTVTGLRKGQNVTINIYVRSQNMQNTVNSSAVGTGKQYRLLLERVSNDRTLHLAEVAPKDIIDEDNINEEHSYQTATISHEREEITAEINYGATIVPMRFEATISDAIVTVTGDMQTGEEVADSDEKTVSGKHSVVAKLNFISDSQSYIVSVANQANDPYPKVYTLTLTRKNNDLALEDIFVQGNQATYVGLENNIPVYESEILYDVQDVSIQAVTKDKSAYVDAVTDVKEENESYTFTQHISENPSFATEGKVLVTKPYEYMIYVGSSNFVSGLPDQITPVILRLIRKDGGDITSDLSVVMRVSHIENESGRLATPSSIGASLADPASYEVLINQNATTAYINVTNNHKTTELTAYYPIEYTTDEDGNNILVTDEDHHVGGPNALRMRFSVPMNNQPYITVRVRAKDGKGNIKEYNLNIRRESNDAALEYGKTVDIKDYTDKKTLSDVSAVSNGQEKDTLNGIAGMFNTYVINMPEGSATSKFELKARSIYATIEMYDETKGEFVANSDDVKYLKTTNRLTVVNDREKHLYFRIVPASVSYNPENDKNSQYNDKDGCTYYRLDIINTPVGTGVDKIYVQYTYENGVDNGQLASTDGHTGFIATVPMNLTMTDIKIVPKSAESSIIVDGYSDGSTPGAVVLKKCSVT